MKFIQIIVVDQGHIALGENGKFYHWRLEKKTEDGIVYSRYNWIETLVPDGEWNVHEDLPPF